MPFGQLKSFLKIFIGGQYQSSLTGQRIFFPARTVSKRKKHTASSYFAPFVQRGCSHRQLFAIQPERSSLFQFLPQLLQRPFFDSGHIPPPLM